MWVGGVSVWVAGVSVWVSGVLYMSFSKQSVL